jgi:hypothetical protein
MPTQAANAHCGETKMTSDTGTIHSLYLAMLIIVIGLLFLGYVSS